VLAPRSCDAGGENPIDGAADHHPDDLVSTRIFEPSLSNHFAVTKDHVAVSDALDLLELVTDEKDRLAISLQQLDDTEKLLDFLQGESRCGFVHDDDPRVDGQRPSDRDQMLAGCSEIAQPSVDVETADADLAERLARLTRCRSPIDPTPAIARRVAEKDVLRHRQIIEEHSLLMDRCDTSCESVMSRRESHRVAIKQQGALRWLQDARHDLDERRFPCAVLANKSNDLARIQI
jgi:hypothetical protein